jgi:hypothetical protein
VIDVTGMRYGDIKKEFKIEKFCSSAPLNVPLVMHKLYTIEDKKFYNEFSASRIEVFEETCRCCFLDSSDTEKKEYLVIISYNFGAIEKIFGFSFCEKGFSSINTTYMQGSNTLLKFHQCTTNENLPIPPKTPITKNGNISFYMFPFTFDKSKGTYKNISRFFTNGVVSTIFCNGPKNIIEFTTSDNIATDENNHATVDKVSIVIRKPLLGTKINNITLNMPKEVLRINARVDNNTYQKILQKTIDELTDIPLDSYEYFNVLQSYVDSCIKFFLSQLINDNVEFIKFTSLNTNNSIMICCKKYIVFDKTHRVYIFDETKRLQCMCMYVNFNFRFVYFDLKGKVTKIYSFKKLSLNRYASYEEIKSSLEEINKYAVNGNDVQEKDNFIRNFLYPVCKPLINIINNVILNSATPEHNYISFYV